MECLRVFSNGVVEQVLGSAYSSYQERERHNVSGRVLKTSITPLNNALLVLLTNFSPSNRESTQLANGLPLGS